MSLWSAKTTAGFQISFTRLAAELLVKVGIRLSPRTVRRYMPPGTTPCTPRGSLVEHIRRTLLEPLPLGNEVIRVCRGRIVTRSELQSFCTRQRAKQGLVHSAVERHRLCACDDQRRHRQGAQPRRVVVVVADRVETAQRISILHPLRPLWELTGRTTTGAPTPSTRVCNCNGPSA